LSTQPPAVAVWLLRHFGSSPNNDVVIGDLNERYKRGRSRMWYWRQVATAIVVSFFQEIWGHKLLTIRAILVGWGVFFAASRFSFYLTWQLLFSLTSWSRYWRHPSITIGAQIFELFFWGILTGSLVARLHRRNHKAMVLAYAGVFAALQTAWIVPDLLRGRGVGPFYILIISVPLRMVIMPVIILIGGGIFRSRGGIEASERAGV
jgi:hypothetical protein